MTTPSPPGGDGFEAQGFEALARLVLAIPIEAFDLRAIAFERVVRALQDLAGRLRALVADVQEDLRGDAGDAFGEAGALLGADIARVIGAISGDAAALYRAGDDVAGAQRAMRDLAVERARILAATPSPQVAGQFDELARRVANGLAQTYVQVGTSLPAIPGASLGGTGATGTISPVPGGEPGVVVREAEPGRVPGAPTDEGASLRPEHSLAPPVGAFVPAGLPVPGREVQPVRHVAGSAPHQDVRPTGGIAGAVQPGAAPVLGRVAAQTATRPTSTDDMLPPAVLRSAATLEPVAQPSAPHRSGHAVDGTRAQWQPAAVGRPALGREQAELTTDVPAVPVAPAGLAPALPLAATAGAPVAAVEGRGQHVPGRQNTQNPSPRRPSSIRVGTGDGVSAAAEPTLPVEASLRPAERNTSVVPPTAVSAPAEVPASGSRFAPERGRVWEQENSPAPVARFATSSAPMPVTPLQPTNPAQLPGPAAEHTGPGAPMAPPMYGPMGGMGGGLTGRVEDERTRDVVLQEEPGAWDEGGGAPAVLGRR